MFDKKEIDKDNVDQVKLILKKGISQDLYNSTLKHINLLEDIINNHSIINNYFFNKKKLSKFSTNKLLWERKVASSNEIISDYQKMTKNPLSTTWLKENLNLRSIEGHSQEGHVAFINYRFPNTQLKDIFSDDVLKSIPHYVKKQQKTSKSRHKSLRTLALEETQEAIDNYVNFNINFMNNPLTKLYSKDFFGIKNLPQPANPLILWESFFYGANFDNYDDVRSSIEKDLGIVIGGGSTHLVDFDRIKNLGINIDEFTSGDYKNLLLKKLFEIDSQQGTDYLLKTLEKMKVLKQTDEIDLNVSSWDEVLEQLPKIEDLGSFNQIYIRKQKGLGVSDDIACQLATFLDFKMLDKADKNYNSFFWKKMSAHAADIIDTLTKETLYYAPGGFDALIGKFFNVQLNKQLVENSFLRSLLGIKNYKAKRSSINSMFNQGYDLVSLDEVKLLTALSINPNIRNNPHYKSTIFHSSAKNFLHKWYFENDEPSTIDVETRFVFRKLEELGVDLSTAPENIFKPLHANDITIGFHKTPFVELISYMNNFVMPVISKDNPYSYLKNFFDKKK